MKKILFLIVLVLIPLVGAIQSSSEYLSCVSEQVYDSCNRKIYYNCTEIGGKTTCDLFFNLESSDELLDWLEDYETQYEGPSTTWSLSIILGCRDDFGREFYVQRVKPNEYTLNGRTLDCPKNVNVESNFIKIGNFNLTLFQFSLTLVSLSLLTVPVIFFIALRIRREIRFTLFNRVYHFRSYYKSPIKTGETNE